MLSNYTAKYTKISSGYMGQLVEWPEVITEGKTLEECRKLLKPYHHCHPGQLPDHNQKAGLA